MLNLHVALTTTEAASNNSQNVAKSVPAPASAEYAGTAVAERPEVGMDTSAGLGTLTVALIAATVGSLIAGAFVYNQTRHMRKSDTAKRAQKLRAVRAVLPLSLSSLSEWSADCIRELLQLYHQVQPGGAGANLQALNIIPSLPTEVLPRLEQFAQFGNDDAAEAVANMLGNIQIFTARMRNRAGRHRINILTTHEVISHLITIAGVSAHVDALYSYSRRESEETPPHGGWDRVRSALRRAGADQSTEPDLFAAIAHKEGLGKAPTHIGVK